MDATRKPYNNQKRGGRPPPGPPEPKRGPPPPRGPPRPPGQKRRGCVNKQNQFTYRAVVTIGAWRAIAPPKTFGILKFPMKNDNIFLVIQYKLSEFKIYVVKFLGLRHRTPFYILISNILYFEINKIKFSFTLNLAVARFVDPPALTMKAGGCQRLSVVNEKIGTSD